MSEVVGTAVVEVRADTRGVDTQLRRGFDRAGRDAGKVFGNSFKRNVAAIGTGLLAAGGIVGLSRTLTNLGRDSLKAAADQSAANAVIGRAVRNAGAEMTIFGKSIEETLQAESLLTGIADDELSPAFARLTAVTRDSARSFELLQLAQDIFRVRGGSVVSAAQALAKAEGGQITALNRLIPLDKQRLSGLQGQAAAAEALRQVTQQFGGQRLAFAESDAGRIERARVSFDEIKETLGQAILPTVGRIADRIATWFSDPENQQRVERGIQRTASAVEQIAEASIAAGRVIAAPFVEAAEKGQALNDALQSTADLVGKINNDELFTNRIIEARTKQLIEQQRLRRTGATEGLSSEERGITGTPNAPQERANRAGLQGVAGVSTFDPNRQRQIAELQAELTKSDADNKRLAEARRKNLQAQIAAIGDPRGKNDQERLIRLYGELSDVTGQINDIEEEANRQRADAAEERKRIAEEERERIKAEREEAALEAKERKEAAAQEAKDSKERARSLKEARLSLRLQQAELTKTTKDDKAAIRAQIRFYNDQAKNFRRSGAQALAVEAESKKVSARLALQGLRKAGSGNETTAGGARTDFFQEAANQFRTFGSNIGRAGDPLSGQDARGQFAGFALDRRRNTANLEQDSLNEQQSQTSVLREIRDRLRVTTRAAEGNQPPNRRSPTATDIARVNARNQLAGR